MTFKSSSVIPAAISISLHAIVITIFLFIVSRAPEPEMEMRLEIALSPPVSTEQLQPIDPVEPLTSQGQSSSGGEQSSEPDVSQASNAQAAAAQDVPETQTAAPEPAPVSRPAAQTTQNTASQPAANPATQNPADIDYTVPEMQEQSRSSRQASSLGGFLSTDSTAETTPAPPSDFFEQQQAPVQNSQATTTQQNNAEAVDSTDESVASALANVANNANSNSSSNSQSNASTNSSPSDQNSVFTTSSGVSVQFVGQGRGVEDGRLDLSQYIQQRESNWPPSIALELRVYANGFVEILNEEVITPYNSLYNAMQRMLSGSVFDAAPGADSVTAVVTFQLR